MEYKKILIYGLGISGVSTIRALLEYDFKLVLVDSKTEDELEGILKEFPASSLDLKLGDVEVDLSSVDLIVKSPGIPMHKEILMEASKIGIAIVTDLELAYIMRKTDNFITITGTNGKTSTSTLIDRILSDQGLKTHLVGNIGRGILEDIKDTDEEDYFVIEASSFQLNNIESYRPKVGLLINLSPDHLDWHGSYSNYIEAKFKMFKNQEAEDFAVLNYDDPEIRKRRDRIRAKKIWFSSKERLEDGLYIESGDIYWSFKSERKKIMSTKNIRIIKENVLAAIGVSISLGLDINRLVETIENFKPLEHRMEHIDTYLGLEFINDSKGTNPDSTITAINSLEGPIVLLAGGYDKGSDFTELIASFDSKIRQLILMGKTRDKIASKALELGFSKKRIHMVVNMDEALDKALELAISGDKILLSPACASWGMYKNFEERGEDFRKLVAARKVNLIGDEKNL